MFENNIKSVIKLYIKKFDKVAQRTINNQNSFIIITIKLYSEYKMLKINTK